MKNTWGFFLLLILSASLSAQTIYDPCHRSTEGTDFWFGFMEGRDINGKHYIEINVCSREATTFTIRYGTNETLLETRTIQPGKSERVLIPKEILEPIGSEILNENKGIHLVSEKPVNVYALNYDPDSNDAAVIYPTGSLGTEYFAMCYTPSISGVNGKNSEFVVVASQDNTKIQITPSVETDRGRPAGKMFEISLNKGQLYQVQSMNTYNERQGDLTGTYIKSDKPVALFSGSLIAIIPNYSFGRTGNHLFEQVPPVHAWGRKYYTVPLELRDSYRFRVLASEDNTVVLFENNFFKMDTLKRGEFREYKSPKDFQGLIYADKPILVSVYSQTAYEDFSPPSGAVLEPFMIILLPLEQMRNNANFVVYQAPSNANYFLFIVTESSQISNIKLDGKAINNFITSGDGYHTATIKFSDGGVHDLVCTDPKGGFLAYQYTYGSQDVQWGYGVGYNLDPLLDLRENLHFNGDTTLLCSGSEKILDAGPYFSSYRWNTGDTIQKITVKDGGKWSGDKWYKVTVTNENGCSQTDSVYVYTSRPKTELGSDTASCAPFSLILDAGAGFQQYFWSPSGETTQKISADKTSRYSVLVTDKYGCTATDSMTLTVYPVPKIEMASPGLVCDTTSTTVHLNITGTDPSLWTGQTKWWSNSDKLTLEDMTDTSVKVTVKEWGDYQIFFKLSTGLCDTIKQFDLHFYDMPTSDFIFADSGNDPCGKYSREVLFTGNASPTAQFHWNPGSSLIVDSMQYPTHFRISKGVGSSPEISLIVDDHGCRSDTTKRDIKAIPNFTVSTDKNKGCDTLRVNFMAELVENDPVSYLWDFGNNSSSSIQNPSANYGYPGFYDVGLKVTNKLNGCQAAFLFKEMVKVYPYPKVKTSLIDNMCYGDTLDINYLYSRENSVCTWQIQGARLLWNGNDSIRIYIENPKAYVNLKVDENGCIGTLPSVVTVNRKPRFNFTIDVTDGCQPVTVNVAGINNSIEGDMIYTWILNRQPVSRNRTYKFDLPFSGKYSLGVVGYSNETQCRDTITKPDLIWVYPKPVARFEVDHPIAYIDNPRITFTNKSQDAVKFYWDFGDQNYSWAQNPVHDYGKIGIYQTRLISESPHGCLDTTIQQVSIIPYKVYAPNAFRPNSYIDKNRYFMPVEDGVDPERFSLSVFDRWGQLIFESSSVENKWDGNMRNGRPAPIGNYIWVANYFDLLGFEHNLKGQVMLIR